MAFDAVLCDLDGVLRWWDPAIMRDAERIGALPPGALAGAAFAPERLLPAITGAQTDEQWRAAVASDLAEHCGADAAREVVAHWSEPAGAVVDEVAEILAGLRVPVVLVSNATSRLDSDLAALGVLDLFDGVVNSSSVGVAKPDPAIYHFAARQAGAELDGCLFIDDTRANVEAARALGMTGLHYRDPVGLRAALA
ncbi:putative hydrolase of the HAD superfamily [Saccharopolyspora antimicrobica]|uniref:Hydrolase of the HAD superfamily n=1 Tax=Saccharopolyspora antimicrobica TaxID=455193 RepID=A0A1I4S4P8_9PSEU|nr:HAD-IA family hydrolase [Saccharopolyspora antimicrobica]RKT87590.1 putative hydrolase of the HAD superfamily [Saccharopolyspora antimicrobica]SFM59476.1 putative hydrolase of the HAD superfamily [Saccharopolyspora antimicrobica]